MSWKLERQFWVRSAGFPLDWVDELAIEADTWARLGGERDGSPSSTDDAAQDVEPAFLERCRQIREAMVDRLQQPGFQEAIYLSNPESLARIIELPERTRGRNINSRSRQQLRMAWSYLQRLCTKNDTASFFGPIAWGRCASGVEGLSVSAGPGDWLRRRITAFEHWAIQELANAVSNDPDAVEQLPLRLNPELRLSGDTAVTPAGRAVRLTLEAQAVLDWLKREDGESSASEVARAVCQDERLDPPAVERAIARLLEQGALARQLLLPTTGQPPEVALANQLLRLSGPVREGWEARLERLCALRDALARAAWPERRAAGAALQQGLVSALGGAELQRERGKMYVGRFISYEDCERNLDVELGGAVLDELEHGLQPVLSLYEAVVQSVSSDINAAWLPVFQAVADRDGAVFLPAFYREASKLSEADSLEQRIVEVLRGAWQPVLARHAGAEVPLSSADLDEVLARVRAACARPIDSVVARVHSPDVLLAASSPEAVREGNYLWVLGEVHPAVHTVAQPVARPFCPAPDEIEESIQALLSPGLLCLADPGRNYQRSHINWPSVDTLYEISFRHSASRSEGCQRVRASDVRVEQIDGVLWASARDGKSATPLVAVMPALLHHVLFRTASKVLGGDTRSRLTYGKLVLRRRCWELRGAELPALERPAESASEYMKFARWWQGLRLPRRCFAKMPNEPKPVFVDARNPLSVDLFVKLAAQSERCLLSEMLPDADQLWLRDARGGYTSELRTTFHRSAAGRQRTKRSSPEALEPTRRYHDA